MADEKELLTAQQFMNRLGICKSTLFNWRSAQLLRRGEHYVKIGHKVMYFWFPGLPETLDEMSQRLERQSLSSPGIDKGEARESGPNWDY